MARQNRHSSERRAELVARIEEGIANGKTIAESCMEARVSTSMYFRWRRDSTDARDDPAERLKKLEQENANLKRLVSDLCLQKLVLRDIIASGGL